MSSSDGGILIIVNSIPVVDTEETNQLKRFHVYFVQLPKVLQKHQLSNIIGRKNGQNEKKKSFETSLYQIQSYSEHDNPRLESYVLFCVCFFEIVARVLH